MAFWEGITETKKEVKSKTIEPKQEKAIPIVDEQITGKIDELQGVKEKKSQKVIDHKRLEEKITELESKLDKVQEKTAIAKTVRIPTADEVMLFCKNNQDKKSCKYLHKRFTNKKVPDDATLRKILDTIRMINDL